MFCLNEHMMETCPQLKRKIHKEKTGFLKEKGICFGRLKPGHMSNRHPLMQSVQSDPPNCASHRKSGKGKRTLDKEKGMMQGTAEDSTSHGVKLSACGHIGAGGYNGAGEEECALAI